MKNQNSIRERFKNKGYLSPMVFILALFLPSFVFSQANVPPPHVINSAGTTTKVNGNYYGFNIGEPIVGTGHVSNGNSWNYFTQGFLQPDYKIGNAFSASIYTGNESCLNAKDGYISINVYNNIGGIWYAIQPSPSAADTTANIHNLPPGTYTLTVVDSLGQQLIQVVTITAATTECPVTAYHAFSPNHDGLNDLFIIDNIQSYPDNHVYIYNRWGNLVWEKAKYDNVNVVWNGKDLNGLALTEGTYFYIIENAGPKVLKNWVEITK